ncbi:hypothetical protein BDN72DRAFT_960975 [Pluteus cervinus]|uniref:Uncharacterized protein n=1 Tax=Pluteus cervinus TaxID=181527 RepID=A0ACD3APH7_9AGAR|nr:hypothetical protein BDN72DRAFT_960975 [Pluteus cervinus]
MTEATESSHIYDLHASKRAQIDHQVRLLQHEIQKLHAERNTLLPISSIPNEIISYIFQLCRSRDTPESTAMDMRTLLSLTWVCQQWRTVAMATAPLWAYVGKENLTWAGECLTRSKQAPLEICLVVENSLVMNLAAAALSHIHRTRELTFYFVGQGATDKLRGFLTQPVPVLKSLLLGCTDIPPIMFSGVSPLLERVTFRECNIPSWNSNILSLGHLKHLALTQCRGIPVIAFIQSLPPSLPLLESLELHTTLVASSAPTPPPPQVHFPNLKSLRLQSHSVSPLIQLFKLCGLAVATKVDVNAAMNRDETAIELLQLLHASKRLDHPPIISMQLYHFHGFGIDASFGINGLRSLDDETLSFDVTHECSWSQIAQLFPNLPLHKVTSLTLAIPGISLGDWTDVFAQLIHLEELILAEDHTTKCFIGFIIASTPASFNDRATKDLNTHPVLPFRSLRNLRITHNIPGSGADDLATFAAALKVRHDYGLRLEKLYLPEIMMAPYIELLRDVVDQISINAE